MSTSRKAAACCLLAVPVALEFRAGGYFPEPRLVAGIVAWAIAIGAVATLREPLCRSRGSWAALGGLGLLALVTGLSVTWAPAATVAWNDFGRLVGYVGFLVAGLALLRGRFGVRALEVAILAGAGLAALYALAGRLLPGIVAQDVSLSAAGRIDQPLTYWNAMGALAAVGLVLAARMAADPTRSRRAALIAAWISVPLGLTLFLTFSRGAILTALVGLAVLLAISRTPRTALVCGALLALVVPACVLAASLPAVRALEGTAASREAQGAAMAAALIVVGAAAALTVDRLRRRPEGAQFRLRAVAAGVALLAVGLALVAGFAGGAPGAEPEVGAQSGRLVSVESNRYDYWRVAGGMFVASPLLGEGSGSFRTVWRRERTVDDRALDAHSIYIETPAELGLLGLAALVLFLAGSGAMAVAATRLDPRVAAGPAAVLAAFATHAAIDWDWEMPTLAVMALLTIAALAGLAGERQA